MKSHVITIRVTEEFKNKLDEKSGSISNSEYIRDKLNQLWEEEKNEDIGKELLNLLGNRDINQNDGEIKLLDSNLVFGFDYLLSIDKGIPATTFYNEATQQLGKFTRANSLISNLNRDKRETIFLSLLDEWEEKYEMSELCKINFISMFLTWISTEYPGPVFNGGELSKLFFKLYGDLIIEYKSRAQTV